MTEDDAVDSAAIPFTDYEPKKGMLVFKNSEIEKEIRIAILKKNALSRDEIFNVILFNPTGGAKISKRDNCIVEIVTDNGKEINK